MSLLYVSPNYILLLSVEFCNGLDKLLSKWYTPSMNKKHKKDMEHLSYMDEDMLLEMWLERMREQRRITGGW